MPPLQEKIQSLHGERDRLLKEAKAVVDAHPEGMGDEDLAKVKDATGKAKEFQAQIAKLQEQEALGAQIATDLQWGDQAASRITAPTSPDPLSPNTAPIIRPGSDADEWDRKHKFAYFGEFLRAVRGAAQPYGKIDPRLTVAAAPGLQESVPSDGGFLVPTDHADFILKRSYETGQILRRCRRFSLAGNSIKIPSVDETSRVKGSRWGGVQAYWVDEAGAVTDSKPKFGKLTLQLKKLACVGYVTEEMLEDYGASGTLLQQAFADELAYELENSIISGTGSGQPQGILNSTCLVSVAKETSQTAATINGDNFLKMWMRFWARSRSSPGAVILYNQDCEAQLWKLSAYSLAREGSNTATAAMPLVLPSTVGLTGPTLPSILGVPLVAVEYCSTLGTQGDLILGDFSQYLIADKGSGPRSAASMHVRFLTDEMTYKLVARIDGQPAWSSSLIPTNGSNAVSPFVVLDTRA